MINKNRPLYFTILSLVASVSFCSASFAEPEFSCYSELKSFLGVSFGESIRQDKYKCFDAEKGLYLYDLEMSDFPLSYDCALAQASLETGRVLRMFVGKNYDKSSIKLGDDNIKQALNDMQKINEYIIGKYEQYGIDVATKEFNQKLWEQFTRAKYGDNENNQLYTVYYFCFRNSQGIISQVITISLVATDGGVCLTVAGEETTMMNLGVEEARAKAIEQRKIEQAREQAKWRSALQDFRKERYNFMTSDFKSGPERLTMVIMRTEEYPIQMRVEAVNILGELLNSNDTYNRPSANGSKGNRLTGLYDECSVSEAAYFSLLKVYGETKEDIIKRAVVDVFDNPKGYIKLLLAEDSSQYHHYWNSSKSIQGIFENCSAAKWDAAFDFFVPYIKSAPAKSRYSDTLLAIKMSANNGASAEEIRSLEATANLQRKEDALRERAPRELVQAYLKMHAPTIEQSKDVLLWCRGGDKNTGAAHSKAVKSIPENVLRVLLPNLKNTNPKAYWLAWGNCATEAEALEVYNSNADDSKKCIAISRIKDERFLKDLAYSNNEQFSITAIYAIHDTKVISQIASNRTLEKNYRLRVFARLLDDNLIRDNGGADIDAVWVVIDSFYGTMDCAQAYSTAIKALSGISGQESSVQRVKELLKSKVAQIIADGASVSDVTFSCKGFRLGMYKWELALLASYFEVEGSVACPESGSSNADYVDVIEITEGAFKTIFGYDPSWSVEVLKDHFTDEFGGNKTWAAEVFEGYRQKCIRIVNRAKTLPPRFKGRNPTDDEVVLLAKEQIREANKVRGDIRLFFQERARKPNVGDVYCVNPLELALGRDYEPLGRDYDYCNTAAIVKQTVDGGIIVGCVKEIQRVKTFESLPMGESLGESVYETFRFPNRIFIKTDKPYATGAALVPYDNIYYFRYIGLKRFQTAAGTTESYHSFEPFEMPKDE